MCSQSGVVEKEKVTNPQGLPLEGAALEVANPSSGVRGCGKSQAAEEEVPPSRSCGLDQHLPPSRAGSREPTAWAGAHTGMEAQPLGIRSQVEGPYDRHVLCTGKGWDRGPALG